MSPNDIEDLYELSPMQQGMLFHTLYAPGSGVYINQIIYRIDGQLHVNILREAWQYMLKRHQPLRTSFLWEDMEEPLQVIHRQAHLPWQEDDWRQFAANEQSTRLETMLTEIRTQGFDLAEAPLMRLELLRLADKTYYLIWSHHHLLLDGWSAAIIAQEAFLVYRSLLARREPTLPFRRPFQEYILWLRQRNYTEAQTFWQHYLSDLNAPTPLATNLSNWQAEEVALDRDEPEDSDAELAEGRWQGGRPVKLSGFALSAEQTTALYQFAHSHQLTVNTLVQGAWALLLSRYGGGSDILFGTVGNGRPAELAGSESMIGLFINTLPVRIKIEPQAQLVSWLQQTQLQQAEARQYDYCPLVQIQSWSELSGDLPMFESLLVFENYPLEQRSSDVDPGGITVRALQNLEQTNYPLVLIVDPAETGLKIDIGYETARFSPQTIKYMCKYLRILLSEMIRQPVQLLENLRLLEEEEYQQLIEWNTADRTSEHRLPFTALFRQQANREPDRIALVCDSHQLSYACLEQYSNQLAQNLLQMGIKPETCIGVCLERSLEWAIALLGVLKAGGVYLPLDPGHPRERLALLLLETQTPVVLTRSRSQDLFSTLPITTLLIENICTTNSETTPQLLLPEIHPANLAYIIYTSGSTGTPKGVMIPHQALMNYLHAIREIYRLYENEAVLQFASPNFDVSLEEVLPTWLSGGRVVIWPEGPAPAPTDLTRLIDQEGLTILNLPSSYWSEWVAQIARYHPPRHLRLVIIGSEKALTARLAAWQHLAAGQITLCNAYGLTETTITCTVYTLPPDTAQQAVAHTLPVGRPLANIQAYVLDTTGQPAPIGIPGELYIGGDCLARGYLHNPQITAERFVPHPFTENAGARLYCTGDYARYLPDGNLEILGRLDTQIKLRGFRIEPAEIEARLLQFPVVREALVQAREDTAGNPRLVAYIVTDEKKHSFLHRLRLSLQEALPAYMIPDVLVPLETLPRTAGGKIDIRALPAPEQKLLQSDLYIPPRSPLEEILAEVWRDVLHLERVGRTDHFFKLGGHSLQATQVVARLRELLRLALPVRAIYDAPTIKALALKIERDRQQALGQPIPAIQPAARNQPLPLSFAQQRLWFLDRLQPDDPFYTIANAFYLKGKLDIRALEQSFQDLIQRHEALRTTFALHDTGPVQYVHPRLDLSLPLIQLFGEDSHYLQSEHLRALIREEARRPFDLTRLPLLRATLLRLNAQEHVLLLTMHHIITDAWSAGIFFQELSALYTGYTNGQPATLPALPIHYADYALWQHSWLQGPVLEQQLAYWCQQLLGAPTVLELPTDRVRPAVQTFRGALHTFTLPLTLTQHLQALSREEGVTLFMTLLAGLLGLLFRYTNQPDLVIGTPISGRHQQATEGVIGLFLNMLALRTRIDGDLTYRNLLQRVREVALEAYMHQDVPFEKLVEALQAERNLSYTPLFQVLFTLQNAPDNQTRLPGLSIETLGIAAETTQFDLSFELYETPFGLEGTLKYSTDLFDASTISRMMEHWQRLLSIWATHPDYHLKNLPLLTERERQQLLVEWNDTKVEYDAPLLLHHLVEAQVARTPDAIALVFEDACLSYQQLDQLANQLAHYLRSRLTAEHELIGICLHRCLDLLIGLLAILKAGCAYLPLDPDSPPHRLSFMLQQSQAPLLLTQQHLLPCLPEEHDTSVLCFETLHPLLSGLPDTPPACPVLPQQLAYVIYTSGSTGTPKGAMLSHRGIANRLLWMQHAYELSPADRVVQKTPYSFDVSLWELFWPLICGAALVLAPSGVHRESRSLLRLLQQQAITTVHFVPSMLSVLLSEPGLEACRALRQVMCSGEALPAELPPRFFARSQATLHNLYGPTEASVDVTSWQCEPSAERHSIPIGRPIANTQLYVLDPQYELVPLGVAGELYLAGVGLARGYLRQPALTAERFVPHPFASTPGERLYRTGDRVRYREDGALEFLGRLDQQVKLRGFRIELGEIEAALRQHPTVHEAVVRLREDIPGTPQLVAYIVPATPSGELLCSPPTLHEFLLAQLPAYMIPSAFVTLQQMPLSLNGKLDYKALPTPERSQQGYEANSRSLAITPIEDMLIVIWSELLHCAQIGIEQNFFALGGHSLLATQVISRVSQILHIDIPLRALFETPTILGLTKQIERALLGQQGIEIPPLTPVVRAAAAPLSFAQQRLWFLNQLDPDSSTYSIPLALLLQGVLDVNALSTAFMTLVDRHESLRTHFENQHEQPVQVIDTCLEQPLRYVDLSTLPAELRTRLASDLIRQEARAPFKLEQGPLMRTTLLRLDAAKHILLLSLHHSIADGWSLDIIRRELFSLYTAFSQHSAPTLPELAVQYADFAIWQRQWLRDQTLAALWDYWKQQLDQAPILDLPTDKPRPTMATSNGATRSLQLPQSLYTRLKTLSLQENSTLFMLLLTAFQILLARYSGQEDICVGTPVANRNHPGTEQIVGFFVNTLVLRTRLHGNPTLRQLLQRVRETCLDAYTHQDLPFEYLVEALQPERDLSRHPLFQVMFALHYTTTPSAFETPHSLSIEELAEDEITAKFDLSFDVVVSDEDMSCTLVYNTDLFAADTVENFLQHWHTLLEGIVADPDCHWTTLPLLSAEERFSLLTAWNTPKAQQVEVKTFHELFERQAASTPQAVALLTDWQSLSYQQINERSNQVAHYLRSLGVGPEVCVGLYLERSAELVIGLLGILKAGGTYVPLDPAYPRERLAFIFADTRMPIVLTSSRLAEQLPSTISCCCLDRDWQQIMQQSPLPLSSHVGEANAAYIIYTSGSTGNPKGVVISHHSLLNYLAWAITYYQPTGGNGSVVHSSIAFDLTITSLLAPLACGGHVHLIPEAQGIEGLSALLRQGHDFSLLKITPAHLELLSATLPQEVMAGLVRTIVIGGEALQAEQLAPWRSAAPCTRLINEYGPTETVVGCCIYEVDDQTTRSGSIPIGQPIANMQLYVLDRYLQPVPIGVPGELYIGGFGLARGYLNAPEMTAEAFIPHPFVGTPTMNRGGTSASEPGARLYRTGDRARLLPDRNLVFLGRGDRQVKIRGFRIELDEIESLLIKHPAVREVIVMMREDNPGEKHLVAYVVPRGEIGPEELQRYLQNWLPEYMLPTSIVSLEELPLTPHGKVDRRSLPIPQRGTLLPPEEAGVFNTPMEEALAELWAELLHIDLTALSPASNFFRAGGHSLLATRLIAHIRQDFGVEIPLRSVFEAPTLARLAEEIEAATSYEFEQVNQDLLGQMLQQLETTFSPEELLNGPVQQAFEEGR